MKKIYETYEEDEFVSTLLTQISWSNHRLIMSKAKTQEERHFYIILCIKETYSARELERQMNSGYYERYMLSQERFILELGKDFTFIDEEFKVHVGGEDFAIDLLFFHRNLQCLVAIELKIGKFKPEYISKMDFYLEAFDKAES